MSIQKICLESARHARRVSGGREKLLIANTNWDRPDRRISKFKKFAFLFLVLAQSSTDISSAWLVSSFPFRFRIIYFHLARLQSLAWASQSDDVGRRRRPAKTSEIYFCRKIKPHKRNLKSPKQSRVKMNMRFKRFFISFNINFVLAVEACTQRVRN